MVNAIKDDKKNLWRLYKGKIYIGKIDVCERNTGKMEYFAYYYNPSSYEEHDCLSCCGSFVKAKKLIAEAYEKKPQSEPKSTEYVKTLPMGDSTGFYPTPADIVGKMYACVDWEGVETVLEPSAGKGDLINNINKVSKNALRYRHRELDVDCIEIDQNLQHILRGKGYRVIFDDFLSYSGYKKYDLIIMNPPFDEGDKHLLKALEMQKKGGQIVCLLNAETLRNPYTIYRKTLLEKLKDYGATITYINNGFGKAQRKTNVEIAMIYVNVPSAKNEQSDIYEYMEKAVEQEQLKETVPKELAIADFLGDLITRYNIEVRTGLELIRQYQAAQPYLLAGIGEQSSSCILTLSVGTDRNVLQKCDINEFLIKIRFKYWEHLLIHSNFLDKLTTNLREQYYGMVRDMQNYEFCMFNINTIITRMNAEMVQGVKDTVLSVFEKLTQEHSWYPECKNNIHFYSGWKTNKAHKVGKKVIVPTYGVFSAWNGEFDSRKAYDVLTDIEKSLNYLDGDVTAEVDLWRTIEGAKTQGQTKNIECKYFFATFYKKGTVHLKFKDMRIIDTLNIYAGRCKSWLPPSYGNIKYNDLSEEEKAVINDFQGKESYENVMANKQQYLYEPQSQMSLALPA